MPKPAPRSNEAASGSGTICRTGTTVDSAAVPHGRRQAASQIHTRCPTSAASTPTPTASTTPAPSWPGTCGGSMGPPTPTDPVPRRDFQSVGLTPDRCTRTRTSPGPGAGSGRSTRVSTDGSPVSRYSMARMPETVAVGPGSAPARAAYSGPRGRAIGRGGGAARRRLPRRPGGAGIRPAPGRPRHGRRGGGGHAGVPGGQAAVGAPGPVVAVPASGDRLSRGGGAGRCGRPGPGADRRRPARRPPRSGRDRLDPGPGRRPAGAAGVGRRPGRAGAGRRPGRPGHRSRAGRARAGRPVPGRRPGPVGRGADRTARAADRRGLAAGAGRVE